jgi:hypothetical protein
LLSSSTAWQSVFFACRSQFARVVKGVDLRSTARKCAWVPTPQLTSPPVLCWQQSRSVLHNMHNMSNMLGCLSKVPVQIRFPRCCRLARPSCSETKCTEKLEKKVNRACVSTCKASPACRLAAQPCFVLQGPRFQTKRAVMLLGSRVSQAASLAGLPMPFVFLSHS